jgi:hypothetical protein
MVMETPDGLSTPMVSMRKIGGDVQGLFASRLAPTGERISNVGASLLAKASAGTMKVQETAG